MTKRYISPQAVLVYYDEVVELPDWYELPLDADGNVDIEQVESDMWNDKRLYALQQASQDETYGVLNNLSFVFETDTKDSGEGPRVEDENGEWL